jgi:hypothetical protein
MAYKHMASIPDVLAAVLQTVAMAPLNTGWCARTLAEDTRDIKGVWINWGTVTNPITNGVQLRAETIDTATGKPTGTLYDANASVSFTPTAGWQNINFAVLPTTGRTVGSMYGLVLLTTGTPASTTLTLNSHVANVSGQALPATILTAADGTTRSNFAEGATSTAVGFIVYEDNSIEPMMLSGQGPGVVKSIFGTARWGAKMTHVGDMTIRGVWWTFGASTAGTPSDLLIKIRNAAGTLIAGFPVTVDKDGTTATGVNIYRRGYVPVAPVTLLASAGPHYIYMQQTDTASTVGNRHSLLAFTVPTNAYPNWVSVTTTDDTTSPSTWTLDTAEMVSIGVRLDDVPAQNVGGGGGGGDGTTAGLWQGSMNQFYPKGMAKMLNGNVALLTDTIKCVGVNTSLYTIADSHEFLDSIPTGARIGTAFTLASKTLVNKVFDAADGTLGTIGAGSTIGGLAIYKDTGNAATSSLLYWIGAGARLPITTNGTAVPVTWHPQGIWEMG